MEKLDKTNSILNTKSIISLFYGVTNSAWVYLCPPYIEITPFESLFLQDKYSILQDYLPDIVVINKDRYKTLRGIFSDSPIVTVKIKDVKQFFSGPCLIAGKSQQSYVDYCKKIETYFNIEKSKQKKSALQQCVFSIAMYELKYFIESKLWIFENIRNEIDRKGEIPTCI